MRSYKNKNKDKKKQPCIAASGPSCLAFSPSLLEPLLTPPPSPPPGARVKGPDIPAQPLRGDGLASTENGRHGEGGSSQRARLWAVGLQEPVGCSLCPSLPSCGSVSKPCLVLYIFLTTGQSFLTCLPATSLPPYNGHTCQSNDLEKEITQCHLSVKSLPMTCHQTWNKSPVFPPSDSNTLSFVCLFI